jgi:hypothetical protein
MKHGNAGLWATAGLVGIAVAVLAQGQKGIPSNPAPGMASKDMPTIAFEKYELENGLEVILAEDHRLPRVAVNVWYHAGPANEEPGRTGFAHLFEHMMFQGTKHIQKDSHFRLLSAAGATNVNGTTSPDRTNYFETVPSNRSSWPCGSSRTAWATCWMCSTKRAFRTSRMSCVTSGGSALRIGRTASLRRRFTTICIRRRIPTMRT